jgi:hypothetical protein
LSAAGRRRARGRRRRVGEETARVRVPAPRGAGNRNILIT